MGVREPHLDGFLIARRGEFRLTEIAGSRTRLEGTTWYQHHLWPAAYWRLWSDAVIHWIHRRVLEHIKRSAEGDPRSPSDPPVAGAHSEPVDDRPRRQF